MKKNKKILIGLICLFVVLLGTTLFISFSSNVEVQEVIVKSITPVYDENSTVVVDSNNVVFNDKNQVVDYKVVIENTQDYDVKITDITLSTPTEEFLQYTLKDISKDDVLAANSTKELIISLETMGIEGWGRNFADELTANVSFEKVAKQEEVTPPTEETPKEEDKQPEAPATNIDEVITKSEKIEVNSITNNTIEFKDGIKLEEGEKAETWIYPETEFYGYEEADKSNTIKEIVLEKEKLDELEVKSGEHNVVISTEEKEVLGYVEIYINENKELLIEKTQDTTDKEENKPSVNKPSEDKKEEPKEDEDDKIENPYTSDKGLLVVLIAATGVTGLGIILVTQNKFAKYTVLIILLSNTLSMAKAEEVIELPIKINVSFESQNVMKPAGVVSCDNCYSLKATDYWVYGKQIEKIYIQNEISEIEEYAYKFDVSQQQNGRVIAYLVPTGEQKKVDILEMEWALADMYDLYLQADGIIYSNPNASYYFKSMYYLNLIDNIKGFDTSNATDMSGMFSQTASHSEFLELDLSSFDTSNVTNMSYMFDSAGYSSETFTLDVSNFDTSNVTDMRWMFSYTGYGNPNFTLDVSNFDTSNVTNMSGMFYDTGYSSETFTLDVSNFDTSKVTDMSEMFNCTGYNSAKLNTSITISNPNTTSYTDMFKNVATKTGSQITVNSTRETEILVAQMIATKSSSSNVVKGICVNCGEDYIPIGTEIDFSGEKFNVISQTSDAVTMLAQYNLGTDYKQSTTNNYVSFSDTNRWEYKPGPKEIDIQTWSTNPKTYVNEYVTYLQGETGDTTLSGDLITLTGLKELGCIITDNYSSKNGLNCENSLYKSWLVNRQVWWTRSADSSNSYRVWVVDNFDRLSYSSYSKNNGVRPVITISKDTLSNLGKI